jgi:hypothetical protein
MECGHCKSLPFFYYVLITNLSTCRPRTKLPRMNPPTLSISMVHAMVVSLSPNREVEMALTHQRLIRNLLRTTRRCLWQQCSRSSHHSHPTNALARHHHTAPPTSITARHHHTSQSHRPPLFVPAAQQSSPSLLFLVLAPSFALV